MAQLKNLRVGESYPIKSGEYAGKDAVVQSVTVEPDGSPEARKIPVEVDGQRIYILPRLIDDGTVTPTQALKALINAPAAVQVPSTVPEQVLKYPDNGCISGPASVSPLQSEVLAPITSPDDPRLDPYRPSPSIVKQYVSRTLPGGRTDVEVGLDYWRRKKNLLLVGDTQSGKTMLVQVLAVLAAKEAGYKKPFPVFTLSGADGISNYELFGQSAPWIDPETGVEKLVWLDGIVSLAARVGGFLYIDEASALEPRTTQALHPLCDDRRHFVNYARPVAVAGGGFVPEIVNASPELWIVGTYNEGYRGTGMLAEALINRFVTIEHGYDDKVETRLITSPTVRLLAEALRTARANSQIQSPVGTSLLRELSETAATHGAEYALWAFTGSFPGRDRERVRTIIKDRSIQTLLDDEVRQATNPGGGAVFDA